MNWARDSGNQPFHREGNRLTLTPGLWRLSPARLGGAFAALMIGLSIVGGIRNYSAIPYWDMWDSTLNMMLRLQNGDTGVWWAQHNEHRIILSRGLFWLDYTFFDGMSYFLILANYAFATVAAFFMYLFMKRFDDRRDGWTANTWALLCFIVGALFLWTQSDNFTHAFQSEFFLAQLLPLMAFYFLARSATSSVWWDFAIACLLGILSAGTLASGVIVAPLMLAYVLVLRQGHGRAVILLITAVVIGVAYFKGYSKPGGHGSLTDTLLHRPLDAFNYAMMFLGTPFNFLVGGRRLGALVALIAGIVFTITSAVLVRRWFFTVEKSPFAAALLFFIAYIGASAVATAGGRLALGEESVFALRYTTPALMAWAALLLLLWHRASFRPATDTRNHVMLFVGLGALMLTYQAKALRNAGETLFPREVAALALTLDINDEAAIKSVYPVAERARMLSAAARPLGLSFFGQPPYAHLDQALGMAFAVPEAPACLGSLDAAVPVDGAPAFILVTGWMFDPLTRAAPRLVRFVNDKGLVTGFAMVGKRRQDVAKQTDARAEYAGFVGYVQVASAGSTLVATGQEPRCRIDFRLP